MSATQTDVASVASIRSHFPALERREGGIPVAFFDGPGGTQVPRAVADAMTDYLLRHNANTHWVYPTSVETDAMITASRAALADFLGGHPSEVVFGANMTTLTFALSRAIARTWQPGDEILVTRLDHDANVTPWVLAARDAGVTVRHVEVRADDCTLDLNDLRAKLSPRTRLLAVGCASNAVGTVNPVKEITQIAHAAGAQVFLDAVHYAPHATIDVADWGCDYLACSAYKFFGPHVGVVWGRRELLEGLAAYKVRPASDGLPGKWMTGTQNHEGIAGTLAAVEYLEELGRGVNAQAQSRRAALLAAYEAIVAYEQTLVTRLLDGLARLSQVRIYGITDPAKFAERVPTVSITHRRLGARELGAALGERGIFVWHGNFYALPLTDTLGLEPDGMVRIGLLHYNTAEEVDCLLAALAELEKA